MQILVWLMEEGGTGVCAPRSCALQVDCGCPGYVGRTRKAWLRHLEKPRLCWAHWEADAGKLSWWFLWCERVFLQGRDLKIYQDRFFVMNESKHSQPCRHQVTQCGLASALTKPRRDVGQRLRVSAYGSISPCPLRTSLRPGVTHSDWIQDSCCLDTLSQNLDPTRETHVSVCRSDSHSSAPVFVTLPGLSFKDKLSTFSTVPQNNRSAQTPHPRASAGLFALTSSPSQENTGWAPCFPPWSFVFEVEGFALELGECGRCGTRPEPAFPALPPHPNLPAFHTTFHVIEIQCDKEMHF